MKKAAALAVVGGDLRQAYLARLLRADGHEVSVYALERQALEPSIHVIHDPKVDFAAMQAIILPVPVLQDEKYLNAPLSNAPHRIETIFDSIPSGKLTLGGSVQPSVQDYAAVCHVDFRDYLTREELAVRNAVPTASAKIPRYRIVFKLRRKNNLKKGMYAFGKIFKRTVIIKIIIISVIEHGIIRTVAKRALSFDLTAAYQHGSAAVAHRKAETRNFLRFPDVDKQHPVAAFKKFDILLHAVGKGQVIECGKDLFELRK
ncbi:MAG: dipicolinate synthase subunit A N-terminal domain-containing protein [Intestinibacillus sp.]